MSCGSVTITTLDELPTQALAAILGGFGSGKALSTFCLSVARGNHRLRATALSLCRGVLVQRFIELAARFQQDDPQQNSEIKTVLDAVREDCRQSRDNDEDIVRKLSEWCAILDYFELHWKAGLSRRSSNDVPTQWIVWCGRLQIPYGEIHGFLATPNWTVGALQHWRRRELSTWSMTHPRNPNLVGINLPLYGSLLGVTWVDSRRLRMQLHELALHRITAQEAAAAANLIHARNALVSMDEVYEEDPTIAFGTHQDTHQDRARGRQPRSFLECFWDSEDGEEGDWEEAVAGLGEAVIRVMKSSRASNIRRCFESCLRGAYEILVVDD